ncbi:MAG: DUF3298 domain-containing protein [Lachnospiraceae bacterium]|nr:DUF3298 domain-containing protein [Lachnospiraceae bacterium]
MQSSEEPQGNQYRSEPEILAYGVQWFTVSEGKIYLFREQEMFLLDQGTREEKLLAEINVEEDLYYPFAASCNRGIFLTDGQLFVKYFTSEDKGVLWHVWDAQSRRFVIFEDMEPLRREDLVRDSSEITASEIMNYCPGRQDEEAGQYLEGEMTFRSNYGDSDETEKIGDSDGNVSVYSDFQITLPRFGEQLPVSERLNGTMEELMKLALEEEERFYQDIEEMEERFGSGTCSNWYLWYGYDHLYIGEKYISMYFYSSCYSGGIRSREEAVPLIFARDTGQEVFMDDLFTVDRIHYMKRLTAAVYKMCELEGIGLEGTWDSNVLVKNFRPECFYLTPDGLVLCYDIYTLLPGAAGNPTFEIPYERFADIFR